MLQYNIGIELKHFTFYSETSNPCSGRIYSINIIQLKPSGDRIRNARCLSNKHIAPYLCYAKNHIIN